MLSISLPRIQMLDATNLDQTYQHTLWISLLRGLAAVQVAAAHVRAQLFPSLRALEDPSWWYLAMAFLTGFAHQAVVVFFVLSGWLVGGSLLNRLGQPGALAAYAIDRVTRMWLVLIPAFVLTLLLGATVGTVDLAHASSAPDNEYSLTVFIANLCGLQDMLVPRYGGNFALWSLANEIWYYVLFPLVVLSCSAPSRQARLGAALVAGVLAICLSGQIVLYFSIWLLGAGFSRVRIVAARAWRAALLALLLALSVYYRLTGSNDILTSDSYVQDLILSLLFLAFLSTQQFKTRASGPLRIARSLAEPLAAFSFTLYVIHVPLLLTMRTLHPTLAAGLSPHAPGDLGVALAVLAALIGAAYLFHLPFEAQTYRVRRALKALLAGRRVAAA